MRSIQIEIHATTDAEIALLMKRVGYHLDHRHHTSQGQKAIDKGADPMSLPHNAVFIR